MKPEVSAVEWCGDMSMHTGVQGQLSLFKAEGGNVSITDVGFM